MHAVSGRVAAVIVVDPSPNLTEYIQFYTVLITEQRTLGTALIYEVSLPIGTTCLF